MKEAGGLLEDCRTLDIIHCTRCKIWNDAGDVESLLNQQGQRVQLEGETVKRTFVDLVAFSNV